MYTVKQAAETLKIPPASLRYYDRLGIVSPMRAENGYRYYSEEDLRALRYVSIMKYAHFSLPEIKIIMDRFQSCENESGDECNAICQRVFLARLAALRDSVANLQEIIVLLSSLIPMIDSAEKYFDNQEQVYAFMDRIYHNISAKEASSWV